MVHGGSGVVHGGGGVLPVGFPGVVLSVIHGGQVIEGGQVTGVTVVGSGVVVFVFPPGAQCIELIRVN